MKSRLDAAAIVLVVLSVAAAFIAGVIASDVFDRDAPIPEPPPPPAATGPLGLPSGYDREAEDRYEAQIAAQDTALREREAETVELRRKVEAAESAAEALRQQAGDFETQLAAAAHVGDDVIESAEHVDLSALTVAWRQRLEATQQVARMAEAQVRIERQFVAALQAENESLRMEVGLLTDALTTARERVDYLSQPRFRWGPGATVGVQPHDVGRPTLVVGFSVSWS